MFKIFKFCVSGFLLNIIFSMVAFASPTSLDMSYSGSGVVSFREPLDIASYQVYYAQNLDIDSQVYLGDLSKCPLELGLFCIAKSISRSGDKVYLNLKDSMKDTVFAIRYKNINGEISPPSNLIDVKKSIEKVNISAFSDSKYIYFEVFNTQDLNLNKFSFEIYHNGQNDLSRVDEYRGCKNYVYLEQNKCVSKDVESIGENIYRINLKDNFKNGYRFVITYKDSHSDSIIYSNSVYLNKSSRETIEKITKLENVKVNDKREIFFDLHSNVNDYFVSYSKDYPGYSPRLSDMDSCIMESIGSKCSVSRSYIDGSRMYLRIRPDLEAGFFVVYYEDSYGRLSPLSRPVYVKSANENRLAPIYSSIDLRQTSLDEISFRKINSAKKYFLVHTYGDKVGFLYHSDFPGCKYSGLNCAGYNIREIYDKYYIKIRPEKTGNRFAVYYEDFSGNISSLSNSVFIPRAHFIDNSRLIDINFTEYFEAISALYSQGIVNGYPDSTFRPYKKINRAEFLKIAIESYFPEINMFNPNYTCFDDVLISDWFNKYVCFAKKNGIISGYIDGSFRPMQNITLSEALKVSLNSSGVDFSAPLNSDMLWYSPYLELARNNGFLPLSIINQNAQYLINRGEMAYITYKILNN